MPGRQPVRVAADQHWPLEAAHCTAPGNAAVSPQGLALDVPPTRHGPRTHFREGNQLPILRQGVGSLAANNDLPEMKQLDVGL